MKIFDRNGRYSDEFLEWYGKNMLIAGFVWLLIIIGVFILLYYVR